MKPHAAVMMLCAALLLFAGPAGAADTGQKRRARSEKIGPGLISRSAAVTAILPVVNKEVTKWNRTPGRDPLKRVRPEDISFTANGWQVQLTTALKDGTMFAGGRMSFAAPARRARKTVELTWGLWDRQPGTGR